jgi:signal recognition particle receptor subunit beta
MSHVNQTRREVTCTVIYGGPTGSGKTTSLRYLGGRARPNPAIRVARSASDVLSLDLGTISGFSVRFQVYALMGGIAPETRQLMLNGADGIVFVADSQAIRFDENRAALVALQQDLEKDLPLVMQYNKQDLPRELLLPTSELAAALAPSRPAIPSDALHGAGVFEAFTSLSSRVLAQLA